MEDRDQSPLRDLYIVAIATVTQVNLPNTFFFTYLTQDTNIFYTGSDSQAESSTERSYISTATGRCQIIRTFLPDFY